jgi:hypothetical protein
MAITFNGTQGKLTFDQLDVLEDILNAAIVNADKNIDVSELKVVDEFLKIQKGLKLLTEALINSILKLMDTDASQESRRSKATKAKRN